jgi:hypothetical protein
MRSPFGAVGASTLITATITAFYDFQRARGSDFFIYPDYFLFHVGGRRGDHRRLDIWPPHKEVVVADDPDRVLEAVNDRAITRLAVEEDGRRGAELDAAATASARARITTCLAYSASGRVHDPDVTIRGNPVTEGYVADALDPDRGRADEVGPELRARIRDGRAALLENGVPVETFRRMGLEEALGY